jgi:hypothetical protein
VAVTALIPGLKVSVEGVGDEKGRVIATKVHFTEGDLKTAQAIQAGLSPTASKLQATDKQVQANQQGIQQVKSNEANLAQRFGELGEYDTKGEATVYFAVGSTTNLGMAILSSVPDLRSGVAGQSVTFTAIVTNRVATGPAPTGTVKAAPAGEGADIIDGSGKRYFDALSGLWNVHVGHGRTAVVYDVIRRIISLTLTNVDPQ